MIGITLMILIWLLAIWTVALIIEKVFSSFGVNMNLSGGIGSLIKLVFEIFIKLTSFLFKWLIMEPLRFLYRLLTRGTRGGGNGDRLYSNPFLNFYEMALLFNKRNKGMSLDSRYILNTKDTASNAAVLGNTGSGKGATVLIPSLLTLAYSAVVINTGRVLEQTAGYLQSIGYRIQELNLKDISRSWRFNPLAHVGNSFTKAKKVAKQLIISAMGEGKDDPFWNLSAQMFCATLIALLCQQTERRFHNMANLLHLVNLVGRGKHPTTLLETAQQTVYDEYMATVANEKTLPSIISTIKAALEIYVDPDIALLSSENTLDFSGLRDPDRKTVIYITCPETEIKYYKGFLALFYQTLWAYLFETGSETAHICQVHLDEMPNLGQLDDIVTTLSQNRKMNAPCIFYTQSISQLKDIYGAEQAASLINACANVKLFLPRQQDPETLNYLERVLGRMRDTYRDFRGKKHEEIRSVLSAPEIRQLKKSILLMGGRRAATFKPKPFYKDSTLLKRSKTPMQQLNIPVHKSEIQYFDM